MSFRPDKHTLAVLAILILGILLRTLWYTDLPPGLYHDEAWNGLDAARSLDKGLRIFYPNNFGREPLHLWLTAASIRLLGHTPTAIRLPALLLGSLALVACYLLARELAGRRVAVWALAVMAFTLWPIHLCRMGFRVADLPFFLGMALWQMIRGYRTGRMQHWVLGGVLYGLSFYTYLSARFTPIALGILVAYLAATGRLKLDRARLDGGLAFIVVVALSLAPLAMYAAGHPDIFFLRVGQTSVLSDGADATPGTPFDKLATSVIRALGMFNVRGDRLDRHNFPTRPVFDLLMGGVFLLGCYEAIRRARQARYALVLIWTGVMLGPTILSLGAPNFLRSSGLWPVLALLPAWGLDRLWQSVEKRWGTGPAYATAGLVLLTSLSITAYDYFVRYSKIEAVRYAFEDAGLQLTHEVNTFLGAGWTRGYVYARGPAAAPDRRVYIDLQLWKDFLNAQFLIPRSSSLVVPGSGDRNGTPDQAPAPTTLYAWWNPDYMGSWLDKLSWLPPHARISMHLGPPTITDMAPAPHPAYIAFTAIPYTTTPPVLARWVPGLALVEADAHVSQGRLSLRLAWLATQVVPLDYTVFVHAEQAGNVLAQHDDGPLAGCPQMTGCLPMTHWRPGDIVVDQIALDLPSAWDPAGGQLWLGLYHWSDGQRIEPVSDRLTVANGRLGIRVSHASP